jgi:hypothetical protein
VRAVVVAVDVAADAASRVVERLVLAQPYLPLLEFPEPQFDEGLRLRVAVATAAMLDPERGEPAAEAAGGEADPLTLPRMSSPGSIACTAAARSISAIASSGRQRSSGCQATISRVQQSIIAIR